MLHAELSHCLGFPLLSIESKFVDGVRWYQVKSFRLLLGLTNTTVAGTQKVPTIHKRRIDTLTMRVDGREITTQPLYVTEVGLWIIVMLNNNPRIKRIRERLAADVFPRISQVR